MAVLWLAVARSVAQEPPSPASTEVEVIRPPEGSLRRGRFAVPDWAVYAAGGLLGAAAVAALVLRSRASTDRGGRT